MVGVPGSRPIEGERFGTHGVANTAPAVSTPPAPLTSGSCTEAGTGSCPWPRLPSSSASRCDLIRPLRADELPHIRIVDSIRVQPSDLAAFVDGHFVEDSPPRRRNPRCRR